MQNKLTIFLATILFGATLHAQPQVAWYSNNAPLGQPCVQGITTPSAFVTLSGTLVTCVATPPNVVGVWTAYAGTGTVTSVLGACGIAGTVTTSGTLTGQELVNAQTGTSYTVLAGDCGKLLTFSNGSAIAVTIPTAGGSFPTGFFFDAENKGAGTATLTPSTGTIGGNANLALTTGQGCRVVSDGTNWQEQCGGGTGSGGTILGTLPASASLPVCTQGTANTVTTSGCPAAGNGNAAAFHSVTFSTTPALNCGSSTAGTVDLSELSTALTAAISPTISTCRTGQLVSFEFTQDATGGRIVTWPSGWTGMCQPSPVANITTAILALWDGATAVGFCSASGGPAVIPLQSAPSGPPPSGSYYVWPDSTGLFLRGENSAGTVFQMAKELTAGNIRKAGGANTVDSAAAASDIVGLFSTCSGTQYLGADGACHNAGSGNFCVGQMFNIGYQNLTADSNPYYLWNGTAASGWEAAASLAVAQGPIPAACTATGISVYLPGTAGSMGTIVVSLYDVTAAAVTSLAVTIPANSTAGIYHASGSASLNVTHLYSIQGVNASGTTVGGYWALAVN
jgi:hypothetical protein